VILDLRAGLKRTRLSWLDYVLLAVASCCSLYSLGMALHEPSVGYFFLQIALVGTVVSAFVHRFAPRWILQADGYLYCILALVCVFFARRMNALLPEEGFPFQLIVAGIVGWMLSLCSFFSWRDGTLLFQAVPSIAIFGLVGAWDTFPQAPYVFFVFLLCFATIFARAHGRSMMAQATDSGFEDQDEGGRTTNRLWNSLREGPWRWMAGPEWALGSAAVVVLLSVLGAPLLQLTAEPIAGFVRINVPRQRTEQRTPITQSLQNSFESSTRIGRGPMDIGREPVMRIRMDRQRYLRTRTYEQYLLRGWGTRPGYSSRGEMIKALRDPESEVSLAREAATSYRVVPYRIELLMKAESLPLPGEFEFIDTFELLGLRRDATLYFMNPAEAVKEINGIARIPDNTPLKEAGKGLPDVFSNRDSSTRITPRVRELTEQVVEGLTSDFDKAMAIKHEIERRVRYNINAPAVPEGADAVEHTLFVAQEGYCDVFASCMVVMARAANLPARYATGFFPTSVERDNRGYLTVRESDAHAWAELFFEGYGWHTFDPTEGADQVPGAERGSHNDEGDLIQRPWVRGTLLVLLGMGLLAAPFALTALARRRPVRQKARAELDKMFANWIRDVERRTGKPRRPSQTATEYLAIVNERLGPARDAQHTAHDALVSALYSPTVADREELDRIKGLVKGASKALKEVPKPRS
jgi:transglutaminase-like putative cysteine protease